jgi:hypothetical protein
MSFDVRGPVHAAPSCQVCVVVSWKWYAGESERGVASPRPGREMNEREQRFPIELWRGPARDVVVWKVRCWIESVSGMGFPRQAPLGIQVEVPCFARVMLCTVKRNNRRCDTGTAQAS